MGLFMLGFTNQGMAACAPSVPGAGATVTCTGNDTTGVSGNAANVTVNTDNTTNINTTGVSAIDLGTGAAVNVASSAVVNSNVSTITVDGGTVTSFANSTISSSTGPAIQYTGAAGTAFDLTVSGTVSGGAGTAVDFGSSNANLSLTPTHNFVGNVVAGAGVSDILRLSSSSNGSFNVSDIGTKYTGFDQFQKNGTSIWTLTGTGNQAWNVTNGSLVGTVSNLSANITNNGNVTFNNTTGTYSSIMSGAGTLTKSGTGDLTLSGANTYTGGTTISGGSVTITANNNLGGNAAVLTMNGGALNYGASVSMSRNVSLVGGGTFNTGGSNATLSGVISGAGVLSKSGSDFLALTGNNTYTGGTLLNQGIIRVNTGTSLGAVSGALTISNNATLQYQAGFTSARNIVLGTGGGTINTNGASATISGIISGSGMLTRTGAGGLTLSGVNTYTGGTLLSGGTLQINSAQSLGDVTGDLTFTAGQLQYSAGFDSARNIAISGSGGQINTNGNNATISGVVSGTAGITKVGTGNLILTGTNTYTGGTIINAGTVTITSDDNLGNAVGNIILNGGTLQSTSGMSSARNITLAAGGGTILKNNGGPLILSGVISGAGSLLKTGNNVLSITGANTYSGGTTISGGTLSGTTTSLQGNILNNATLTFNQSTAGTYAGVLSGTGVVNIAGTAAGDVRLSGANSYSGTTNINAGTLRIDADTNIGTGALNFNGGTLQYLGAFDMTRAISFAAGGGTINTNGFDSSLSGVLSGTGALTKSGTGMLTLTGVNTHSGATNLNAGTLRVNGSTASTITVGASGRLEGTGTVAGVVANGTVAPGNSIGTLNVNGPVTFNPGSVYEVEVDDAGNSDLTVATGAITINGGTVDVRAAAGTYAALTNYTILQGLSVAGTFTSVTSNLAFLDPSLTYNANNVVLNLTRNDNDFSTVAQDSSQVQVANAVEELGPGNDLYDAFVGLSNGQAVGALESLSGEHNVGLTSASVASSTHVQSIVANRIQTLLNRVSQGNKAALHMTGNDDGTVIDVEKQAFAMLEPSAGGLVKNGGRNKNFWSEVFGLFGRNDSRKTAPSQNRDSAGVLFGTDMALSSKTQIGVFGGWEKGEVYTDTQAANSDVESWHGGLYANYAITPRLRLSGSVSGNYQDIDTTRHVQFVGFTETAKGNTEGYGAAGFIEAGYTIPFKDIAFEPYANINIIHGSVGGYRETDGGSANLDVDSASITTPGHSIGIRAGKHIQLKDTDIDLHAKIGWDHRYGDLSDRSAMRFQGGTSIFNVSGTPTARNAATIGAGADVGVSSGTRAYVGYEGSYASDERNHGVSLGVKVSF